jgi:hypothetical protein
MIENINLEKKYCMYMQVQHSHLEAGFLKYIFSFSILLTLQL